ncbi:MAG: hypothetical protein HFI86_03025 [Bacilli bacterium]|nr:hypothetical protein [Bacilli bacterium]MCI9434238.1 hypothetical protein [Bacilli bacterium]
MNYNELYSNGDDCKELAQILNNEIKGKIAFSWNVYAQIMGGSYNCIPSNTYNGYLEEKKELVKFYYKFLKDGFLRIGVGNNPLSKKTVGHKLAALSDFYQVLSKNFGEPTLFYTEENDDEEYLNFEWAFKYKKEVIEAFKNNTIFDDGGKVKDLIIIGEQPDKFISNQLGLPIELLNLVNENIEDFIKYRQINLGTDNKQPTEKRKVMKI